MAMTLSATAPTSLGRPRSFRRAMARPRNQNALMTISRTELARMVDHTLLKPEATAEDVAALCAEAGDLGVFSVCISPSFLPLAPALLPSGIATCTVVGFPSGKHHEDIKAAEAHRAVADGALEVDMVVDIGAIKAGLWQVTEREVAAVRAATRGWSSRSSWRQRRSATTRSCAHA